MINMLKGAVMGMTNVIPGVSGGTMLVSLGIFDQLIYGITHLFKEFKKSMMILLPFTVGMLSAIVAFSFIITFLFERFPMQTAAASVGLILGGIPPLMRRIRGEGVGISGVAVFVIFFMFIIILQIFGGSVENEVLIVLSGFGIFKLLLIGVIAAATMIVPGVSGSMMLMIMGYYKPVIGAVRDLASAVAAFDRVAILYNMGVLLPFGIGVLLGIFFVAKALEVLLKRYEGLTYCAILGLVSASPVVVFMSIGVSTVSVMAVAVSVLVFAISFAMALRLSKGE